MWGPLILVVVALSLSSQAGAGASAVQGGFSYANGVFDGSITSDPIPQSLVFVPPGFETKQVDLEFTAQNVIVNWTDIDRYDVADPTNPSRAHSGVQKGPPTQGERDHGPAQARATLEETTSNLLLSGLAGDVATSEFVANRTTIQANPVSEWIAGSRARETVSRPDPNGTLIHFPLPVGQTEATLEQTRIRVTGNITILLWDAGLDVTDAKGLTSYWSGSRSSSPGAGPVPAPFVAERQTRLLTLRLIDADVIITITQGHGLLVSNEVPINVNGNAQVTSALGTVGDHAVLDETLDIAGVFSLNSRNESTRDPRVRGELSFLQGETSIHTGSVQIAAPAPPENTSLSFWWSTLLLIPAVFLGVAGYRRFGPVSIEDVEWAILGGKRRAHRLARRLVDKQPRNADAVFLYATTLLERAEFGPLIEKVEPLATKIPPPARVGIAFVLAVAAHTLGDAKRRSKWATEASRDPELANKLKESGLPNIVHNASGFLQSGYA